MSHSRMLLMMLVPLLASAQPTPSEQTAVTQASTERAQPQQSTLTPEQRGDLFMARKMYREAIDTYKSGQQTAIIWDKIGIAYHQLGDLAAARKAYERAVKIDKKYADAINNIGTVYYAEKKYRSAISRYNRALQIAPDNASVWSNLGTAYYARGKFDLMTQAYTKAL